MKTNDMAYSIDYISICSGNRFWSYGNYGHTAAWVAMALCFFAATMIIVGLRKNKA